MSRFKIVKIIQISIVVLVALVSPKLAQQLFKVSEKDAAMTKERKNKITDFRIQIKALMVKHNISVAKLARHPSVDLHHNTLYNYLQGNSEMTGANIEKVLDTLLTM
jgi:hypothetical protein